MTESLRVIQLNMNGQIIVAEQLRNYCRFNHVDLLLLQDPPTTGQEVTGFRHLPYRTVIYDGDEAGAAVVIINTLLRVTKVLEHTSKYMATARVHYGTEPRDYITAT